jgi:hypothetical protein
LPCFFGVWRFVFATVINLIFFFFFFFFSDRIVVAPVCLLRLARVLQVTTALLVQLFQL